MSDKSNIMTYENVEVYSTSQYGTRTRLFIKNDIGDHFWVYADEIVPESTVKQLGDQGTLMIPLQVALDRGLHESFDLV